MILLLWAALALAQQAAPAEAFGPPAPAATSVASSSTMMPGLPVEAPGAIATDATSLLTSAVGQGEDPVPVSTAVRLLLFLTGLSFLPAMLVVMTPFVRFVIVFSLLRQALGLSQSPPNQVIIGLSLFLTLLVMQPVFGTSWDAGVAPFLDGTMQPGDALTAALDPMREFMLANTRRADMAMVLDIAGLARPESLADLPTSAVASAFVLSELKTAFIVTVYVFIPFLVIDLVVSSILLGMGMMMLPPVVVSLPFKLMIFVLMDGWALLVRNLVEGIAR